MANQGGRPYSVTPVLPPGRKSYVATFRDATGKRVNRGLGTQLEHEAKAIALGLVFLRQNPQLNNQTCPRFVHPSARVLYWPGLADRDGVLSVRELGGDVVALGRPPKAGGALADLKGPGPADFETHRTAWQLGQALAQVKDLEIELARVKAENEALRESVISQVAKAKANCPAFAEVLEMYRQHKEGTVSAYEARDLLGLASKFVASLPPTVKNPAGVTADHVERWLDAASTSLAARDKKRNRLGRFLRWASRRWDYPCIMDKIRAPSKAQLDRLRGPIHWHELDECEDAIDALGDSKYWTALVATLAYAGLQLDELCWLRISDLEARGAGHQLWITNQEGHVLKTARRERHVAVHPELLWPRLEAHLAELPADAVRMFPPQSRRRKRGKTPNHGQWLARSLTVRLVGGAGGKNKKATAGMLPEGMSPSSLRRTFGSLLVRSGKTTTEVAAAMGNTEAVVSQHYARLRGAEVDVDF